MKQTNIVYVQSAKLKIFTRLIIVGDVMANRIALKFRSLGYYTWVESA